MEEERMEIEENSSFKHRLEYAMFVFWGRVFSVLPYRMALATGWGAAWIGHYLVRYRVNMVHERIRSVFPDYSARQVRRIAWLSWRHFVYSLVDIFRLPTITPAWLRRHIVDHDQRCSFFSEQLPPGGAIGVSLHMGSAEVLAVCLQHWGRKVFVISKAQKNRLVNRKLLEMRCSTGMDCILKTSGPGVLKQVFKRLRQGQMLTMLVDLRSSTGGVEVDFLGQKANVVAGMGLFARQTGVPIVCSIITREGWTRHRMKVFPILFPDETLTMDADIARMTQTVFQWFDQAVREQPEQWFWYNKNWILTPVDGSDGSESEGQEGAVS